MKPGRGTIGHRLILAMMATTTVALILTGAALVVWDVVTFRAGMVRGQFTRAEILAANSRAALVFDNSDDATQVLAALRTDPHTVRAILYDAEGNVFATYPHPLPGPLPVPPVHGSRFEPNRLLVSRPVIASGRTLGTLLLESDLQVYASRLQGDLLIVLLAILGASGISLVVAAWLQRGITEPIRRLAAASRQVSEAKDFSVRVPAAGHDEVGQLTRAFNEMLVEIQRRDAELERRVADRTAELQAANRELEAFSYSVSHDLRAPLRAIDGFSRALLEDCEDQVGEEGRRHLDRIRSGAQEMAALINDLLELARLSRTAMERVNVDLAAIARDIAGSLVAADGVRSVEWVLPATLEVQGDPKLLRVVLDNLLRNAWKFTSKRQRARIELGAESRDGRQVLFVRDDGAGFDLAHAERLFQPFQRLHRKADFEGTGVGLATVQRVIHRHGGRIWADSAPDRGATFSFTLWERGS